AENFAPAIDQVNSFIQGAKQALDPVALSVFRADQLVHAKLPKGASQMASRVPVDWLLRTRLWFNCANMQFRGQITGGTGFLALQAPRLPSGILFSALLDQKQICLQPYSGGEPNRAPVRPSFQAFAEAI